MKRRVRGRRVVADEERLEGREYVEAERATLVRQLTRREAAWLEDKAELESNIADRDAELAEIDAS